MSGADEGIGVVQLEYTQDGGLRWKIEHDASGDQIKLTGTAIDPLLAVDVIGRIENESPKPKLYRWRCISIDAASAAIPCYLYNRPNFRASVRIGTDLYIVSNDVSPTGGVDGDGVGFAGTGSLYCDTDLGLWYRNDGTSTMPIWVSL